MIDKLEKLSISVRNYTVLVSLILVFMSAAMMFFYSPLCPGGDFYVHFNRMVVLMDALRDGSYPIYMDYYMIDGYGYLIKAFYSDVILIPFAIIGNFTSPTFAYQVLIFTLTFFCGFFTYIAVKKIVKCKYSALLTTLLYTFATYRIFDVYVRGALGEVISFTLLPIVLWGAYEIIKGDYKKWYILTIAFSLLIFSHVISTVLSLFTLVIFLCIYYKIFVKEPKRFLYLIIAGVACIPLTAYYVFPMIEQMLSNTFYYETHKLVDGVIGFKLNEVIAGLFNGVSLRNEQLFPKLGTILTVVVLLRVFIKEKSNVLKFVDTCAIVGLIFIFMTTPLFPWKIFPFSLLGVIQFPWRLLEYTSFLFAIAGAYYLTLLLKTKKQKLIGLIGIIAIHILIFNSDSIHYRTFICNNGKPEIKVNTSFLGIIGGEYLPSNLPSNNFVYDIPGVFNDFIHNRGQVVKYADDSTKISNFNKNKGHITFDAEVKNNDNLELPLTYYIGYRATLDGKEVEYQQSEFGLIEVPINKSGKVEVEYVGTTLQQISLYITLINILLLITYIIIHKKMVQIAKLLSNSKYNFWIFFFLLISMTSAMMYFYSPLCPGIDFHVHYNRFLILMEALNEGNFPVYMDYYVIDGYGYILKLFYSDFLLIPFAWIGNLTNDVLAYNIMIFTVTLICGISTYKASKAITKSNFAAILTAILYTFCAYRMGNIYMRGALGESLALSFLPVILWGGYEIIFGDKKKWYILAIGFSLLIFSHVISSVISLITLFIFLIIGYKYFIREPKRIVFLLVAGIVTLLLTAYYTLPMLEQMFSNSFYYQTHKLIPFMVTSKITDLTAGLFNIILEGSSSNFMVTGAILTVGVLTRLFVTTKTKILKYIDITVGVAMIYLVISLHFFPWDIFPFSFLKFIQCTWRFFGQVSIIFALAGGYYMSLIAVQKNKRIAILFTLVIIQLFVFNSDSFFYKTQICKDKTHDLSINTTFFGIIGAEYLPSKLPKNTSGYPIKGVFNDFIHNRGQVVKYADDSTKISNFNKNKGHITFDAEVKNNDNLELPLTYYIGYKTTLDGQEVEYQQSEFGLIEVPINKSGKVEVEYVGTTLQQISLYITLISIIILLLYIAKLKYGRKNI